MSFKDSQHLMLDFFHWCYSQHLMLAEMNVAGIYASTTGYLLTMIYFCWCGKYRQYSITANPDFNNISIENYKQNKFPTFMLSLYLYVISSLNWLYLHIIHSRKFPNHPTSSTLFDKIGRITMDIQYHSRRPIPNNS